MSRSTLMKLVREVMMTVRRAGALVQSPAALAGGVGGTVEARTNHFLLGGVVGTLPRQFFAGSCPSIFHDAFSNMKCFVVGCGFFYSFLLTLDYYRECLMSEARGQTCCNSICSALV